MNESEIVENIQRMFPAFVSEYSLNEDSDLYGIFMDFSTFLIENINENPSDETVNNAFNFINTICDTGNEDFQEMLEVTIFEKLLDTDNLINITNKKLKGSGSKLFDRLVYRELIKPKRIKESKRGRSGIGKGDRD